MQFITLSTFSVILLIFTSVIINNVNGQTEESQPPPPAPENAPGSAAPGPAAPGPTAPRPAAPSGGPIASIIGGILNRGENRLASITHRVQQRAEERQHRRETRVVERPAVSTGADETPSAASTYAADRGQEEISRVRAFIRNFLPSSRQRAAV